MALVWGIPALYIVLCVVLWATQERITFPAPRSPLPDPATTIGSGERIELRMTDGTRLVGWYIPAAAEGGKGREGAARAPGLLWFYGNGETIGAIWPILRDFRPRHAALLVVDYPGYGASDGRTSEAGIYEAGDLAYRALSSRPEVDSHRIYVYGRSLGSAVATHVAATHAIAGLILESPFNSARGMAARHYGIFPRFLVRLRLDNLGRMPQIHRPTLIFHGTADALVPMKMGREVAAAAGGGGGPVEFIMIEGADHNDTYDVGGKAYRDKLAAFVK
ncbi:MAG TPA: alpha/beta hydrolase [Gemmatimonadales bacterium]|nr:alpha/beta hydrolase [Gemmatimonadales bacterium]